MIILSILIFSPNIFKQTIKTLVTIIKSALLSLIKELHNVIEVKSIKINNHHFSIKELVELTHLSTSTISHRIGILEKNNYIIRNKTGRQISFSFNLNAL